MRDAETVDFVRKQAAGARYVTSVCTGALLLGVAGLLQGRRATTHWAQTDLLPLVGATFEKARIVTDGNIVTAAGVASGIDFALHLVNVIAGATSRRRSSWESSTTPPHRSPRAIRTGLPRR